VVGGSTSDNRKFVVLDIETTGLRYRPHDAKTLRSNDIVYDEILQFAIVDAASESLFYDSFSPIKHSSWTQAQSIHGIAPRDIKDKAPFSSRKAEIQTIIDAADLLVAYNANFDLAFLSAQGIELQDKRFVCLMKSFAQIHGRRGRYHISYT
jgi:DNA polymerase-3 subunit epsilon